MSHPSGTSNEIWVLGEIGADGKFACTLYELSSKARELALSLAEFTGESHGVKVVLLVDSRMHCRFDASEVSMYGTDRVSIVSSDGLPSDRAASARSLAELAKRDKPKIILAAATSFGRSVMPYAAALLKTGLTADCTGLEIDSESGLLLQMRPAIGGNIMATIKTPSHLPQMATVRPRTFKVPPPQARRDIEITNESLPWEIIRPSVETIAFERFDTADGTLQERDVIVSGGRGLRRADGFALISHLASLFNGGIGASRAAVEMKWIGYRHQIGLSGQTVSPKVYIAAGISGSVQHIAGIQRADKIISINRDPEAQIFSVSDVAVCGDLYEVIPLLAERIEARRRNGDEESN